MKKILIWIILTALVSCSPQKKADKNKGDSIGYIAIEKALDERDTNTRSMDELIEQIEYIPLETKQECLLDRISKIIPYKNYYYIYDRNGIFKFDGKGKFVCEIGKKGRGSGEYSRCSEITIHHETVYINALNMIVAFDAKSGRFLATYPFPKRHFFERTNAFFVALNSQTGNIEFINENGITHDTINYERFMQKERFPEMIIYPIFNPFFGTNESLKISTSHNDTIFEIDNNRKLIPRYILNLGKYKLPDENRIEYHGDFEKFDKESANYLRPVPLETNNYLAIQFGKWGVVSNISPFGFGRDKKADLLGLGIYNKKSGEFYLISEDKEKYPCFYPHFSDGENSLISFVDAIEAVEFYKQYKNEHDFCKPFVSVIKNIDMEDNPVLINAKLKSE